MLFYVGGQAIGTIWVMAHGQSRKFAAADLRVMTNLAHFAAAGVGPTSAEKVTLQATQALPAPCRRVAYAHADIAEGLDVNARRGRGEAFGVSWSRRPG